MSRRAPRLLGGVALLALCLTVAADLGAAGPAASSPGVFTVSDPVGDVVGHAYVQDGQPPVRRTPELTKPDVTSTRVSYTREALTIRAEARQPVRGIILTLAIRAPGADYSVFGYPGDGSVIFDVAADSAGRPTPRPPRECRRKDAVTADAAGGYYQWVLPSSCFGAPEAIRVGLLVTHEEVSGSRGFISYDDALRVGSPDSPEEPGLSVPIRRT